MTTIYIPITWHVWKSNPIDYVGKRLITRDGKRVELRRGVIEFEVYVDGERKLITKDVPTTCAILEQYEVGLEAMNHDSIQIRQHPG
mgnify:CR=1 FL=1